MDSLWYNYWIAAMEIQGFFPYSNEKKILKNPVSAGDVTVWNALQSEQAKVTEEKLWYNVIFIKVIFQF